MEFRRHQLAQSDHFDNKVQHFGLRLFLLLLLLPLLVTASFAYQAGNNFEYAAGHGKLTQSSQISQHIYPAKHPSDFKSLLPNSPDVLAAGLSLLIIYKLIIQTEILRSFYPKQLKQTLMKPLKYTGNYVDGASVAWTS